MKESVRTFNSVLPSMPIFIAILMALIPDFSNASQYDFLALTCQRLDSSLSTRELTVGDVWHGLVLELR
jgi:hypothetical protein